MLFNCGRMLLRETGRAEQLFSLSDHTCYCFGFDRAAGVLRGLIWLLPGQRCTSNWCFILLFPSYWHTKWNSSYRLLEIEVFVKRSNPKHINIELGHSIEQHVLNYMKCIEDDLKQWLEHIYFENNLWNTTFRLAFVIILVLLVWRKALQ